MKISEDFSLSTYNTFGIEARTKYFISCETADEIVSFRREPRFRDVPFILFGGGSNILFTKDYSGVVLKPALMGIETTREDEDYAWLRVGAGEEWDAFVQRSVEMGLGGVENLSGIPGTAGSSPVQNIGAYGCEVKDTIQHVELLNLETLQYETLQNNACRFAYRDSVFKREMKGKAVVLAVMFRLSKKPQFITGYGNIQEELKGYSGANLETMRELILAMRRRKLPDPAVTGNAGSFFKNPVIDARTLSLLRGKWPALPNYPLKTGGAKIPAAWLIEQCGWKGYRKGDAGVHQNQPLVLVNYGKATGEEILQLSREITDSVTQKFNIRLETEVNIV